MQRLILVVAIGLLAALPLSAQENSVSGRLICQTENAYRIEVSVTGAIELVTINPSHAESVINWEIGSESQQHFDIGLDNESVSLIAHVGGLYFYGDEILLSATAACDGNESVNPETVIVEALRNAIPKILGE